MPAASSVTINTDDPSISSTTLTDEYMIAIREIGLPLSDLGAIIRNGVNAAFLDRQEKERLWNWFQESFKQHPVLFSAEDLAAAKLK